MGFIVHGEDIRAAMGLFRSTRQCRGTLWNSILHSYYSVNHFQNYAQEALTDPAPGLQAFPIAADCNSGHRSSSPLHSVTRIVREAFAEMVLDTISHRACRAGGE
jgi:hypothetical protein